MLNHGKQPRNSLSVQPVLTTPKRSSVHEECSFDNPNEKILAKGRNFFAQDPKKTEENHNFFQKKVSSKCSSGHVVCSFDNIANFLPTASNFAQCPKKIKKIQRKAFTQNVLLDV